MTVEEPADHRLRHRPAADERETLSRERHRPKVCRAHEGMRIALAFRSLRRAYGVVRPRAPPVAFLFSGAKRKPGDRRPAGAVARAIATAMPSSDPRTDTL